MFDVLRVLFNKGYLIRMGYKMEGLVVKVNYFWFMSLFSFVDNYGKIDWFVFFNELDFFLMFIDLGIFVFWKNVCSCEFLSVLYLMWVWCDRFRMVLMGVCIWDIVR